MSTKTNAKCGSPLHELLRGAEFPRPGCAGSSAHHRYQLKETFVTAMRENAHRHSFRRADWTRGIRGAGRGLQIFSASGVFFSAFMTTPKNKGKKSVFIRRRVTGSDFGYFFGVRGFFFGVATPKKNHLTPKKNPVPKFRRWRFFSASREKNLSPFFPGTRPSWPGLPGWLGRLASWLSYPTPVNLNPQPQTLNPKP